MKRINWFQVSKMNYREKLFWTHLDFSNFFLLMGMLLGSILLAINQKGEMLEEENDKKEFVLQKMHFYNTWVVIIRATLF